MVTDGWRKVSKERNPNSDVPYFFAENDGAKDFKYHMTLKKEVLMNEGIPAGLKELQVSFEFVSHSHISYSI